MINRNVLLRVAFVAVAWLPTALVAERAAAAETGSSAAGESDISSLAEIIVTAQRRDESASRTPVSIAVVSADTLDKAQIVSEQDLRFATPGLSVRTGTSSESLNYALRGQSQDPYSNSRPGVLPYVNEVQIGGAGSGTAFYDLQSVQVVKGPQGTLFGRSATGGAVLFTTAKPTDEFSGYASGLAGTHGAGKGELAVSGPLVKNVLDGRVAMFYDTLNGFQNNLYDGARQGDHSRYGFRMSLTAHVGELKNEFVGDYYHSSGESMAGAISGTFPTPLVPTLDLYAGVATPGARATGIGTVSAFTGAPVSVVAPFYDAYFANPQHPLSLAAYVTAQKARSPYTIDVNQPNVFETRNIIGTNSTTLNLNESMLLKNIIGYTRLEQDFSTDSDGTPFSLIGQAAGTCQCNLTHQLSEELQLQGVTFNKRLNYTSGIYVSDEKATQFLNNYAFDILFGGFEQTLVNTTKNRTYAGYSQGTYELTENGLSATIGGRYTSEKITRLTLPQDSNRIALGDPAPAGYSYDQSETYNRASYTLGLQYQLNPDVLLYAASRRAYKNGGFNLLVVPLNGPGSAGGDSFGAEKIMDAELGAKFSGLIADMPTRLDLALWNNWVTDAQRAAYVVIAGSPAVVTVNVPKIRLYGVESDAQIKPQQWLTLGLTANYTHSKILDTTVFAVGRAITYDTEQDTPVFSGAVYSDIDIPLSSTYSVFLHGDAYSQSKSSTSSQSANSDGTVMPAYTLADFRIGLQNVPNKWTITANVKNAFNRVYYVGGVATAESYQLNLLIPGTPRTFTVEGRVDF